MIRTAKEWAEFFTKLVEADPDQKVWAYVYDRTDIDVYNSPEPDGFIPKGDWERVIERFERYVDNDALENVWSAFSDATSEELVNLRCDDCYEYNYDCVNDDNGTLCSHCGEEKDVLEGGE